MKRVLLLSAFCSFLPARYWGLFHHAFSRQLGIAYNGHAKAYDWNDLVREKLVGIHCRTCRCLSSWSRTTLLFMWNRRLDTTVLRLGKIPGSDLFQGY